MASNQIANLVALQCNCVPTAAGVTVGKSMNVDSASRSGVGTYVLTPKEKFASSAAAANTADINAQVLCTFQGSGDFVAAGAIGLDSEITVTVRNTAGALADPNLALAVTVLMLPNLS